MSIGARIQKLRKSKSLSQEEFADIMKVSRQSVSKWELDQSCPEINKLIEIADYFNITLDDLIRDNSDENEGIAKEAEKNSTSTDKEIERVSFNENYRIPQRVKIVLLFVFLIIFIFYGAMTGNYYALMGYSSAIIAASVIRLIKRGVYS